jgi:hypothetical protein
MKNHNVYLWFWFTFFLGLVPAGFRLVTYGSNLPYSRLSYALGTGELLVAGAVVTGNALERLVKKAVNEGVANQRLAFVNCVGSNFAIFGVAVLWYGTALPAPSFSVALGSCIVCALAGIAAGASVAHIEPINSLGSKGDVGGHAD